MPGIPPNALTNLKAKFKAVFRKKDKKAKEGDTAAGATEATKADTPAAVTTAAAVPGGGAPAIEAAKTDEAVQPTTDTAAGAATEAKPEDKVVETPVAAADATAKAPAAAEIGVATDTKPAGTV